MRASVPVPARHAAARPPPEEDDDEEREEEEEDNDEGRERSSVDQPNAFDFSGVRLELVRANPNPTRNVRSRWSRPMARDPYRHPDTSRALDPNPDPTPPLAPTFSR